MSELISIVYKPENAAQNVEGYTRLPLNEAELIVGHGIEGDAKGGHPERHLNIMAVEAMQTLKADGFHTEPGQLGEQLIVTGLDVDTLPVGARLQIGTTACVEITKPRTGCVVFERHQGLDRQEAAGRMGMMATVVVGGPIRVGDTVTQVAIAD
jgi:MOSC domain-containing protein YiiM